jgi:hypothetical protein
MAALRAAPSPARGARTSTSFGPTSLDPTARAFAFRGGVRIVGTVVACDAVTGGDLIFVSRAESPGTRGGQALPRLNVRRQLLVTETTLALLGPDGERLRPHALIAGYGRPFALGGARLELFPSDLGPGAASLLCEQAGRRVVYAGLVGPDAEVRAADALCLDARFGAPGTSFALRAEALGVIGRQVRDALAAAAAPVLRLDPDQIALPIATALAADGVGLRAHRRFVQAAAAHRAAGLPAPPVQRFSGRIGAGEALLWPIGAHLPAQRSGERPLVEVPVVPGAAGAIAYPVGLDAGGLLAYVAATGAREVALVNAPGDELFHELGARGVDAYPLGPPRQLRLPATR